jgi:hypothetical protein
MSQLTLRFRDPTLERAFQDEVRPLAARTFSHAILAVALIRTLVSVVALLDSRPSDPTPLDALALALFWGIYAFTYTDVYARTIRATMIVCCLSCRRTSPRCGAWPT